MAPAPVKVVGDKVDIKSWGNDQVCSFIKAMGVDPAAFKEDGVTGAALLELGEDDYSTLGAPSTASRRLAGEVRLLAGGGLETYAAGPPPVSAAVAALLRRIADDPSDAARVAAARALAESGCERSAPAAAALARGEEGIAAAREAVAHALGAVAPKGDAAALTALGARLGDSDARVRRAAARAVGELGPPRGAGAPPDVAHVRPSARARAAAPQASGAVCQGPRGACHPALTAGAGLGARRSCWGGWRTRTRGCGRRAGAC